VLAIWSFLILGSQFDGFDDVGGRHPWPLVGGGHFVGESAPKMEMARLFVGMKNLPRHRMTGPAALDWLAASMAAWCAAAY
jgi:hypothetical protein